MLPYNRTCGLLILLKNLSFVGFGISLDENEYTHCCSSLLFGCCYLPLYSGDVGFSSQSRRFSYGNEIYVFIARRPSSESMVSRKAALSTSSPAARWVSLPI